MNNIINKLTNYSFFLFLFLYPLFFLSVTADSYEFNKMVLLAIAAMLFFWLFLLHVAATKRLSLQVSTFTLPLLVLTLATIASTFIQSPNIFVSLLTPGATLTIISGFILYFSLTQLIPHIEMKTILIDIVAISADFLCVYCLLLFMGFLPKGLFTPAGSILNTTLFIAVITTYLTAKVLLDILALSQKRQITFNLFVFRLLSLGLCSITMVILIVQLFTDGSSSIILLPYRFGWSIFVETLKNIKTLTLGVGPTNFMTAFTLAKPLAFNQTTMWNVIFTSSSSYFLTLVTEIGIIGGLSYILLILFSIRLLMANHSKNHHLSTDQLYHLPLILSLIVALLLQFILPTGMILYTTVIILLSLGSLAVKPAFSIRLGSFISYALIVVFLILTGFGLYFGGRAFLAETKFKSSLDALLNNEGNHAYSLQKQAIDLDPNIDRYHLAYSQISLALADRLVQQKDLKDDEKAKIPMLVQQSIDHAKTAALLYRTNTVNWDNLAKTYEAIIDYAKGSQNWAIHSYQQRISLDPLNPASQVALGNVYMKLKQYDIAASYFAQAVSLKPDYALARFDLGLAYKKMGKLKEATEQMQTTLSLLPPDSADAKQVQIELTGLQNESTSSAKPQTTPAPTTNVKPETISPAIGKEATSSSTPGAVIHF